MLERAGYFTEDEAPNNSLGTIGIIERDNYESLIPLKHKQDIRPAFIFENCSKIFLSVLCN